MPHDSTARRKLWTRLLVRWRRYAVTRTDADLRSYMRLRVSYEAATRPAPIDPVSLDTSGTIALFEALFRSRPGCTYGEYQEVLLAREEYAREFGLSLPSARRERQRADGSESLHPLTTPTKERASHGC